MPLDANYTRPNEPVSEALKSGMYVVEVTDLTSIVEPNKFKKEGDKSPETLHRIKIEMTICEGEFKDRRLFAWVRDSLATPGKKAKNPEVCLQKLIRVTLNEDVSPRDAERVNHEFMNSLIGKKLRVMTTLRTSANGDQFPQVMSFEGV